MRKQTLDLVQLLELAAPLGHYYLFMEDDFRRARGHCRAELSGTRRLQGTGKRNGGSEQKYR